MKMNIEVMAMIYSLNSTDLAKIILKAGDNEYIAEYKGKHCTAIYNPFSGYYYIDDVYGVIKNVE